jgi:hypothetical protein
LRIYDHINGVPMPETGFVVPDQENWPCWMVGMPLGEWIGVAKVQQRMMRRHYEDRYNLLTELGLLWWLPPGNLNEKFYWPVK